METPHHPGQVRAIALDFAIDYSRTADRVVPLGPLELCVLARQFEPWLMEGLGYIGHGIMPEAEVRPIALELEMIRARRADGVIRNTPSMLIAGANILAAYIRDGGVPQ